MRFFQGVFVSALGMFVHTGAWAAPSCDDLTGVWNNPRSSTLTITDYDATTGALKGTYMSPQGAAGGTYPLVGWSNLGPADASKKENLRVISFTVNWGEIGSITSWTGTCTAAGSTPTLKTVWHLARSNGDFEWDHVLTFPDTFTPAP